MQYLPNPLVVGMGTNLEWVADGDGLHLSDRSQPSGAADLMIRSLGYRVLRVPGGWLARGFNWQGSVGGQRPMQRNVFSGRLEPVTTGSRR